MAIARGQRKGHPSPFAKKYRNEMILEMRRSGVSVRKIAEVHLITVERVRQIIRRGSHSEEATQAKSSDPTG